MKTSPRKPLILTGARQIGKTYSLKAFGKEHFPKVHYFNFEADRAVHKIFQEDLQPHRLIQDLAFHADTKIDSKRDLIIFDEIQASPLALTSLKYFNEEMPELALCAAGSLLGLYLNEGSFPVGKVDFIMMSPCTFYEFLGCVGDQKSLDVLSTIPKKPKISEVIHDHLWQRLKEYFIVGGLPEVVTEFSKFQTDRVKSFEKVRQKQLALLNAYPADFVKHSGKVNAMHLERLWHHIPIQLTAVQDETSPKFKFKEVVPGIHGYERLASAIDWLIKAGLVLQTKIVNRAQQPLSAYSKEGLFKLFMFDVGLLGCMADLAPRTIWQYDYGTYKGYFAENFVMQQLLAAGARQIFCWREGTAEVEFLIDFKGNVIPIEVKSGSKTRAKSLKMFDEKYHPFVKVIMSSKNLHFDSKNKLLHAPLYIAEALLDLPTLAQD